MSDLAIITRPLSRKEASSYLASRHGIVRAYATLAKMAVVGGGPVFRKAGSRRVIYDIADLDAWADSIKSAYMRSTSEAA